MTIPHKMVDGEVVPLTAEEISAMEVEQAAERITTLRQEVISGAQRCLDDFARTRGYDGILSACTYATSTVPKFAAEGQYCVEIRDATWAALYMMLAQVEAGIRPVPLGFAEIASDLPTASATWPN